MSTEGEVDGLTDRDREVHDQLGPGDENVSSADEKIEALREENRELEEEVQDLRDELTATKKTLFAEINKLRDEVNGKDPSDPRSGNYYDDLTVLEKYERMSDEERDELLSGCPSKRRAVKIFENWSEWSQRGARDRDEQLISTNQTRGQYNKLALKVDLQSATGTDLQNVEVYRAMKMVAKLSVQDPDDVICETDQYGREHVKGGAFEFHEKVNPDSGNHYKVLTLAEPDAVTLP